MCESGEDVVIILFEREGEGVGWIGQDGGRGVCGVLCVNVFHKEPTDGQGEYGCWGQMVGGILGGRREERKTREGVCEELPRRYRGG